MSWQQHRLPKIVAHALWATAMAIGLPTDAPLVWLTLGFFTFSLSYYLVHRFVLHARRPPVWMRRLEDHHRHHRDPTEAMGLCFYLHEQLVLSVVASAVFVIGALSLRHGVWLGLGFASGFVAFDQLHTTIHHPTLGRQRWVQVLGANHMRHHNRGSSHYDTLSPFWDIVFRTSRKRAVDRFLR